MALNPAEVVVLSRLLDEALELDAEHRKQWFSALPAEHAHLIEPLRAMLGDSGVEMPSEPLSTLPKLAGEGSVASPGERVGPYKLIREIGRGGMGSVWLAERADGTFERQVALKLPRLTWGSGLAERMARERRIGGLLEHPAIARLYDAGVDEHGRPFFAMEYVDGQPIDVWCREHDLDVRARLKLFLQVIRAVAYAHGRLVLHRDLKPANILVDREGRTHLLDFGIAKVMAEDATGGTLTLEQGRVLTPSYASPEQIAGEPMGVASDIYSLGVTLFEVLTGKLPIQPKHRSAAAMEEAVLQGDASLASSAAEDLGFRKALRGELDAIVGKALARESARRYATADAMADDIERHIAGETVKARPDSRWYRLHKTLVRHRIAFGAGAAVLAAIIGGSSVALVQTQRAAKAAERQRLITEYVSDVFRINSSPERPRLVPADLTGDRLLDAGAALIAKRFPDEPEMQAELYGVVSALFLEMSAGAQARQYAMKQIEALAQTRVDNRTNAVARHRLAKALIEAGQFADAAKEARKAAELAHDDDELRAEALASLAWAQMWMANYTEAEKALSEVDALAQGFGRESIAQAWAYATRGSILTATQRYPESGALFQRGIEVALRVEGPLSLAAAEIRLLRADQMINFDEGTLGKSVVDAAIDALRRRGGAAAIAAEARAASRWRALAEVEVVTFQEAISAIENAQAVLSNQPAVPDFVLMRVQFELGITKSKWGEVTEGWHLASTAKTFFRASDSPFTRLRVARRLTYAAMAAGDNDAADAWNEETMRQRARAGEEHKAVAASEYTTAAFLAGRRGRFDEALGVLDRTSALEAPKGYSRVTAVWLRDMVRWAKARILADRGEFTESWKAVSGAEVTERETPTVNSREALIAELDCALGRATKGRQGFDALVAKASTRLHPHSPDLAWLRTHAGLCALASGDRRSARASAEQARAAFTAQPGVSPYYKAPLFRLERALGLHLPAI